MLTLVVSGILLLVAQACSPGPDETRPSGRVGVAYEVLLACADSIDQIDDLPTNYETLGGAIALPTSSTTDSALQTSDFGGADPAARLFAKTGLLIRSGDVDVEIRVPAEFHDRVAMGWGGSARTHTHRLVVPPCQSESEWLVFAGGFWVAEPECITMEVDNGSTVETFTVGIGAPCPGQQPPPYPSDT